MMAKTNALTTLFGAEEWRHRFVKAISWNAVGSIANALCGIGLAIALARILGQIQFGKWSVIQNTAITAAGIAQLSGGQAATKFVAQFRTQDPARAAHIIRLCRRVTAVMAVFATLMVIAGGKVIAARWLGDPDLATAVRLSSLAVFFLIFSGLQAGIITGLRLFSDLSQAFIKAGVLGLAIVVAGALLGGLEGALVGFGIMACMQAVFLEHIIQQAIATNELKPRVGQASELMMLASFAIPAALGGLSSMPAQWFAYTCVARQPAGFAEMGLFGAANTLRSMVLFAPVLANRVSNAFLNYELAQPETGNYKQLFRMNLRLTVAMALIGALAAGLVGPWTLGLFGHSFTGGQLILVVLLIAGSFEAVMISFYQAILSRGLMWLSLWAIAIPRDILIAALAWLLAPRFGALGLAIALAAGQALALAVTAGLARKLDRKPTLN